MIINGEFIKIYRECNTQPSGLNTGSTRETRRFGTKIYKRARSTLFTKKWTLGRLNDYNSENFKVAIQGA